MAPTEHGISVDSDSERKSLLHHHTENHFTAGQIVRDIIIGVSDGLTVPFALAAGLSGANATSSIVLTAGIAEVAAGAISMGLGGYVQPNSSHSSFHAAPKIFLWANVSLCSYLAAKSESDNYLRELKREQEEIIAEPETGFHHCSFIMLLYYFHGHATLFYFINQKFHLIFMIG